MSLASKDGESKTVLVSSQQEEDNNQQYGASQQQAVYSNSSLVIKAPPFTTVHDAEEFLTYLFAKGQHLPDKEDTVQITLCSYREWSHAILMVGTQLDVNYVKSMLHGALLLGQATEHDMIDGADAHFITHVPSDATSEAHAAQLCSLLQEELST
jgi:hypothetical protein